MFLLHSLTNNKMCVLFYKANWKRGSNRSLFYDGHSRKNTRPTRSLRCWLFQRILEVKLITFKTYYFINHVLVNWIHLGFIISTMSTVLNGCALTILEDFVRPFSPHLTDKSATRISKSISFTFGLIGYIMVFLISNMNSILEVREIN